MESLRKAGRPIILHWDLRHFVVLEEIRGKHAWINDPASGRRKLKLAEFDRHFTGVCLDVQVNGRASGDRDRSPWRFLHSLAPVGSMQLKGVFAVGLAASALVFLVELLFGGIARTFFDYVVEFQMTQWGYVLALAGIPVLAARFMLRHCQGMRFEGLSSDLAIRMKRSFLERFYIRPTSFFESHFAGELFGRLRDLDQCLRFYLQATHNMGRHVLIAVLAIAVLGIMAPLIAIVHLLPQLVLLAWLFVVSARNRERQLRAHDENARYQALQTQRASGYLRFYAAGLQNHLLATCLPPLGRRQAAEADRGRRLIGYTAARQSMAALSLPLSAFAGGYLLIDGQLTYGGYMLASMLAVMLSTQLEEISETTRRYCALRPVARRVAEVLDAAEQASPDAGDRPAEDSPSPASWCSRIEARSVSFGYNGVDADLFRNLDLRIDKGEVVNLAGASGAGKTTLLELLAGLRLPLQGGVYLDGRPLDGPAPAGFVFADDEFIHGSLAEFVSNEQGVDTERLIGMLRLTELWDRLGFFVGSDGRERLEEQGLSRGEVQRLLLAQALYKSDECLFFDDAFNHLSLEQSTRILERLRERGMTVVLATHRPEIQALCDRGIMLSPAAPDP